MDRVQVGDWVRRTNPVYGDHRQSGLKAGDVAQVSKLRSKSGTQFYLDGYPLPDKYSFNVSNFEKAEAPMSNVKITYKEDSRPIEAVRIDSVGGRKASSAHRSIDDRNMVAISGIRCYPDDVIEFAEALIKLAKQVKNS